jgi:hypothetical protein
MNRIGDFDSDKFTLYVFCDECHHSKGLPFWWLREKYGSDTTLNRIQSGLRCEPCDSRNCSIRIVYTGAGGFSHGQ